MAPATLSAPALHTPASNISYLHTNGRKRCPTDSHLKLPSLGFSLAALNINSSSISRISQDQKVFCRGKVFCTSPGNFEQDYSYPEQQNLAPSHRTYAPPPERNSYPQQQNQTPPPERTYTPPERNSYPQQRNQTPPPERTYAPPERNSYPQQQNQAPPPQRTYAPLERNSYSQQQKQAPPPERTYAPPERNPYPQQHNQAPHYAPPPERNSYSQQQNLAPPERTYAPPEQNFYSQQQNLPSPDRTYYAPPSERTYYAPPSERNSYSQQQNEAPPPERTYPPPETNFYSQQQNEIPPERTYSPPERNSYPQQLNQAPPESTYTSPQRTYTEPEPVPAPQYQYRQISPSMRRRPYNLEAKMRMKAYRRQALQQQRADAIAEEARTFELNPDECYKKGDPNTIDGVITEIIHIGVIVKLANGREGFLPATQLGCMGSLELMERLFHVGQELTFRVIEVPHVGKDRLFLKR